MLRCKTTLAVLGAALVLAAGASAQSLYPISGINGYGALDHSNGDKVANGRFNTLHTVWEDGALIKYSTSADGMGWTAPQLVAPGLASALPAIASDSNGTLVVAFVGNPNASGMGSIHYAYKPWGATSWTVSKIVDSGTQPDIEARGGKVHVTWTTINRVQYTSFSTTSPPASMAFGEEIEITGCAGTGFVRPSVALARESCKLVPKVAYIRYSDETSNPDPVCTSLITEVGARVCERDPTLGTWGLEYTDLVTATNPPQGVEAVALSMNAHYTTGNTFVAWSDISNSTARTRLAHGRNGTWNAITHSNDDLHVHVAAKKSSAIGEYRLAWVSRGWYPSLPFVDVDGQFRTGKWHSGATPTWTDPSSTYINASIGGILVGHPQATFWGKCSSGLYDTVEAVAELENVCSTSGLSAHVTEDQSCPSGGIIGINPCHKVQVAYTYADSLRTHVDLDGFGDPVELGSNWATYAVESGKGEGYITLSWDRGRVDNTWAGGFSIDDANATVRIQSDSVETDLVRLESTDIYEGTKPGVCHRR